MSIYASTFISGLQKPVKDALKKQVHDVRIIDLYDGLIVYDTKANIERIKNLNFFNNTFLVLKIFKNQNNISMEDILQSAAKMNDIEEKISYVLSNKKYSYRIITSKENKLISVNDNILKNMESRLSKIRRLYLNKSRPDLEFWFLLRREKIGFFMMRLTKKASTEKRLNKGELRPELCNIMCLISDINKDDIFWDPFCGYGSIPIERASMFPYSIIFAMDNDLEKVKKLKQRIKKSRKLRNNK